MAKHYTFRIRGKVQGVWYRASAQRKAEELGLCGIVRNEADGSVYLEAEGDERQLQAMAEWCRRGPDLARVEEVAIEEGEIRGYTSFKTLRQ
ncbi:MAG: acylphosphatase [Phaeodactylibacter sp.]|nr:acylphosphatase [Phaeodactylibacter sp.]MCB9275409.1 acylphosphatase [Lewinellaceae bacterium]